MIHGKRIVICLDGTWQNPYKERQRDDGSRVLKPTNVLKLARAVLPSSPDDGRPQVTFYDAGIGALIRYAGPANRLLTFTDRMLGGVWGAGFEATVEEAFRFLCHNHQAGDRVFLFGFSRGAAAARALANFVDWLGGVPAKGDAYFGPLLYLHWIRTRGRGRPDEVATPDGRRPDRPMVPVEVDLLGVWDTVLALGARFHAARGTSKSRWTFVLRPTPAGCVRHARQALAIDERRFDYQSEVWTGCAADQTLEQRWFAGSHSNIGGGYVEDGLANIPFRWLADEASRLGLALDRDYVKHFKPYPQAHLNPAISVLTATAELVRLRFAGGARPLVGRPAGAGHTLDRSVIHRLRSDPAAHAQLELYRPANLIEYLATQPDLGAFLRDLGLDPDAAALPADVLRDIETHRRTK